MSSPLRRVASALAIVLLTAAGTAVANQGVASAATTDMNPYESGLVSMTNSARANAGLPALSAQPGLTDVARRWAQSMSASNILGHNPDLGAQLENAGSAGWTVAAENVGVGGDASGIFNAYMNSAPHKANILRSNVRNVGIGAVRTRDGRVWDVMVFSDDYSGTYGPNQTAKQSISAAGTPEAGMQSPVGSLDAVRQTSPGVVTASGWALDPDEAARPIAVRIYVDGRYVQDATASTDRPDVGASQAGAGSAHGYSVDLSGISGSHQVCVYALNDGPGENTTLGCRTLTVGGSPVGNLEAVQRTGPGTIAVRGWTLDPDTAASIPLHVYVGGRPTVFSAGESRSDIGAFFPGYGPQHGYTATITGVSGTQDVCAYGINSAGTGANSTLGCRSITLPTSPVGALDSVTVSGSTISARGWALDPDTAASIPVHVYVDGRATVGTASLDRPDVAAANPGFGARHGYQVSSVSSPGRHQVCAYAINSAGAGNNSTLGCKVVTTS